MPAANSRPANPSSFDSSDEEDDQQADLSTFEISWLDLSDVNCDEKLGICGLPGCRFKDTWRSLKHDLSCMKNSGVEDVFCLCSNGELNKYRVPRLLQEYGDADIDVHRYSFPDGEVPSMGLLMKMLEDIRTNLMKPKKTVVHCYGGLGRSCLVAVCLMMLMDENLAAEEAIVKMRELRGQRAIQTVKQYNFINEFRQQLEKYKSENISPRSLSR
ncbi:hypothetical protein ScPMuIL_014574 [Solemya velum]